MWDLIESFPDSLSLVSVSYDYICEFQIEDVFNKQYHLLVQVFQC